VKALVNKYGKNGLRLIEIQKQDIRDFPLVVSQLAEHPQKFILFIDDLSFTEQEGQFRELKALLEGGLEVRPQNVLVYATSNRRHLVQESFADKKITGYDPDNEDVRYMDTVQEKLSLADRFGITVTYTSPDQIRYLKIIEKMAKERRLEISPEELKEKALRWELKYNARSARTAKQFIDNLEGQLALRK
jgi:predicted AAA+ superfamily ATPase